MSLLSSYSLKRLSSAALAVNILYSVPAGAMHMDGEDDASAAALRPAPSSAPSAAPGALQDILSLRAASLSSAPITLLRPEDVLHIPDEKLIPTIRAFSPHAKLPVNVKLASGLSPIFSHLESFSSHRLRGVLLLMYTHFIYQEQFFGGKAHETGRTYQVHHFLDYTCDHFKEPVAIALREHLKKENEWGYGSPPQHDSDGPITTEESHAFDFVSLLLQKKQPAKAIEILLTLSETSRTPAYYQSLQELHKLPSDQVFAIIQRGPFGKINALVREAEALLAGKPASGAGDSKEDSKEGSSAAAASSAAGAGD